MKYLLPGMSVPDAFQCFCCTAIINNLIFLLIILENQTEKLVSMSMFILKKIDILTQLYYLTFHGSLPLNDNVKE